MPHAIRAGQPPARRYGVLLLILVATALLTRVQQFGNPIVHIDEQFYLLVGDRMLSGAVPYVDIWDRKPIGLFLIYAAIRDLGGSGIIQYQLVATGFAVGTALIVDHLASRLAGPRGAMLAAVLYLLWIPLLSGQGGQAPVFYNLFVAAAALVIVRIADRPAASAGRIVGHGVAAMLLIGIAIQIKYSAMFEGGYFGLALIWLARRSGLRALPLAAASFLWIAIALSPTIAAGIGYWLIGHFADFWFANFISIFRRGPLEQGLLKNVMTLGLYLAPLAILAAHGAKVRSRSAPRFADVFVTGWLIVAVLAVAAFGYYFDHYGLPIVVPAAVSAATVLNERPLRLWPKWVLAGALMACLILPTVNQRRRGTPAQFAALTDVLRPYIGGGLLVWDRFPALYYVLRAPLPSRYAFPYHLNARNEVGAVGADQMRVLQRILAARPAAVVIELPKRRTKTEPTDTTRLLMRRLAIAYRPIATLPVGHLRQRVYLRDDLAAR